MSKPINDFKVYIIFTISGASALIYQVIWARWLGLVFGNTTISISIILGCFMLGMAIGSWFAGKLLHRIGNPMRFYGLLEIGIGMFAVVFPFFLWVIDLVFSSVLSDDSSAGYGLTLRVALVFFGLLVPTSLMGATLPVLTDCLRLGRVCSSSRWKVGMLYAFNTFGAALGTLAAGFFLFELIGLRATNSLAAILNFIIAIAAFKLSSPATVRSDPINLTVRSDPINLTVSSESDHVDMPAPVEITPSEGGLDPLGALAVGVLAVSGALAMASEVLWTRILSTLVHNSTYGFSLIVLLFLVGIALGSWLMSLIVRRLKRMFFWLTVLLFAMGAWTLFAIHYFDSLVDRVSHLSQRMVSLSTIMLSYLDVFSLLIPLALFCGACFSLTTRIVDPQSEDARGDNVSRAYTYNTIGATVGSLAAGFVIAPRLDFLDSIYMIAFLYFLSTVVFCLLFFYTGKRLLSKEPAAGVSRRKKEFVALTLLAVAMTLISLAGMRGESRFVSSVRNKTNGMVEVVYHKPGLQGITSVLKAKNSDVYTLLVNGKSMTMKVTDTKVMAHLPMLLHKNPEKTLVLCFGMGTTYRSAISHGGYVTVVELVDEVVEAFDYFYADAKNIRQYPKGRIVINDARNFLKLTKDRFDVITIDPPPPIDAAGVNHLYSRDFMALVKSRLKDDGILAHWIPMPGSIAGVDDELTFNMLFYTIKSVFPYTYFMMGYNRIGVHVIASMKPIDISLDRVTRRLAANTKITSDLTELDAVPVSLFASIRPMKDFANTDVQIVTDDKPLLEFYLIDFWKRDRKKFYPSILW
ncbi:MAG: fused MFS/spermidine synthase [Nitrospirae bacterium]|nr:fused MFS/spermidine synthase [Nitrospirota bacterium]